LLAWLRLATSSSARIRGRQLELDDKVPDHSTFSVNQHGRFRDSDIFRQVFETVVRACMDAGLVKGEGFADRGFPPPPEAIWSQA
jgi:transposase